jgi:formate hydrogenlyase subunit 4
VNGHAIAATATQLGALGAAPLLPGLVQQTKAMLQGRRGPSPLQPYRDLARLWRKGVVDPHGTTLVFELAPALVAACAALAIAVLPVAGASSRFGLGSDALVLVGLLALARFAITAASWDTGSGFSLMGASRDLTLSVFVEALLLLVIAVVYLPVHSTNLATLTVGGAGSLWLKPAHWCAAVAFALVVLAETGRQPVDNPDTHLELTMIHEGPLLEYAGRDLALLQWAAAARHWIVLVLGVELFVPQPSSFWVRLALLAAALPVLCVLLGVVETWQAKLRILWVPRLLGAGAAVALVGFVSWFVGGNA